MKKKILTILGTRPELIKMFPIIDKLDKSFYNKLVWSGQHYDFSMVKQNFQDLKVRKPNVEIKINKKENVFFQIQRKIYSLILKEKPFAIIYHGDTYTTLATSMIANYFFPEIKRGAFPMRCWLPFSSTIPPPSGKACIILSLFFVASFSSLS